MLEYYLKDGVGVDDRISARAIEEYQKNEKPLTKKEAARVSRATEAYKKIQELYEAKSESGSALADLILSEEIEPHYEAVLAHKEILLPRLVDLINDERFEDPLFPGYGLAPARAVKALTLIGGKKAMRAFFTKLLHVESGELQEEILSALESLHPFEFLMTVLRSRPIGIENQTAAMTLGAMRLDEKILKEVQEERARLQQEGCKDFILLQYLDCLVS